MPMTNQISRDELRGVIADKLSAHFGVTAENATDEQVFQAAAIVIREILSRLHTFDSRTAPEREVHYLSMEFLMGRSLMKDAFNLGIGDALIGALEDLGRSAADIFETEPDAGLGNGGLGRLAACYMDSLATEGIPATGYSLCYELGIFRQRIVDGRQTEVADNWRTAASSWLVPCHEDTVEVRFGGRVEPHWDAYGHYHGELHGYESVLAVPRDMLIAPYGDGRVNTLRLWEAHSPKRPRHVSLRRRQLCPEPRAAHDGRGHHEGALPGGRPHRGQDPAHPPAVFLRLRDGAEHPARPPRALRHGAQLCRAPRHPDQRHAPDAHHPRAHAPAAR